MEMFHLVQAAVYHADGLWGEATLDLSLQPAPQSRSKYEFDTLESELINISSMCRSAEDIAWLRE